MNKIHKTLWDAARGSFVVVNELAASRGQPGARLKLMARAITAAALALAGSQALALTVNNSSPNGGNIALSSGETYNNSSSISNLTGNPGIMVSGGVIGGALSNSGIISSNGADAILLSNGSLSGGINNGDTGTISGAGSAIALDHALIEGGIANTGTLSGGISLEQGSTIQGSIGIGIGSNGVLSGGIHLDQSSLISSNSIGIAIASGGTLSGGISNSGTILSTGGGVYDSGILLISESNPIVLQGGIHNSGTLVGGMGGIIDLGGSISGGINNSGLISGGMFGIAIAATGSIISNSTLSGGVTNSGTISGGEYSLLNLGATLDNISISGNGTARFIGDVYAPTTPVNIVDGASFSADNAFEVASFTIGQNALFNMNAMPSSSGTLSAGLTVDGEGAQVSNYGTLALASHSGTITGNYIQQAGGALQIGVGNDAYGQLHVSGLASLPEDARIAVAVSPLNTLYNGATLNGVIQAGSLSASSFDVSSDSPLFSFSEMTVGQNVDLVAHAASVSNMVLDNSDHQALGAARVLDSLIAGAPGNMSGVVGALASLGSQQQVANAVRQTLPLLSASASQAVNGALADVNQIIQTRQQGNSGLSSGEPLLANGHVWGKAFGSQAEQNAQGDIAGFSAKTYGLIIGADQALGDSRLGLALAASTSYIDGTSAPTPNSAMVRSTQLIVYGSHPLDARSALDLQLDLGQHHTEGNRSIAFGGLDSNAGSSYDSLSAHIGAGVHRRYDLCAASSLTPELRVDYTRMDSHGYQETGAGPLDLAVNQSLTQQLLFSLGGKLTQRLSDANTLVADLSASYDALAKTSALTSAYVGGGAAFVTDGINPGSMSYRAGLGLESKLRHGMELDLRYDLATSSGFNNQSVSAKLRWPF
jgi:outer membrane autotransporter protein